MSVVTNYGQQLLFLLKHNILRIAGFDRKFCHLLKNKVFTAKDYYECQDFAVNHPPEYHEKISRSLALTELETLKNKPFPPKEYIVSPPTDIKFYEEYISRRNEFDKKISSF